MVVGVRYEDPTGQPRHAERMLQTDIVAEPVAVAELEEISPASVTSFVGGSAIARMMLDSLSAT
jgi:hypothetical protein